MYVRVNVWQGSIDETEVLLFDTLEEAKAQMVQELVELASDIDMAPERAAVMFNAIADCRHPGFVYRDEVAHCSYFILEAFRPQDRLDAEAFMRDILNNQTGD